MSNTPLPPAGLVRLNDELGADIDADTAWSLRCGTFNTAEQCRVLGVVVGDTIEGREECGDYWHEARLKLLWIGEAVAVWSVTERSNTWSNWSEPEECADWTLECRQWRKVSQAPN